MFENHITYLTRKQRLDAKGGLLAKNNNNSSF